MKVLETDRLVLRHLAPDDAAFILELLNDPSWIRYIGNKKVKTLDDARTYIETGPMAMYARHGFGLFLTELKDDGVPIGLCGLIKRDTLEDVDIGFALLERFWSKGYAREAAEATLAHGIDALGLKRVVAITTHDNEASGRLLERIGLRFERMVKLTDDAEELRLFAIDVED